MPDPLAPDPARGVFTTLLVVDGAPVALREHLERLAASVESLYGERLPCATAERTQVAARGLALGRVRIAHLPGGAENVEIAATAIASEAVLPGWDGALDLQAIEVEDWTGAHKWVDRRLLDALERATAVPNHAPLLVAPGDTVLETTRASIFAVLDDRLVTPPTSVGVLPGVVRAKVLELAAAVGLDAAEAPLTLAALAGASEAFATNAIRLLEPVRSVDGTPLAGPGPVTQLMSDRLRALWL